MSRKNDLLLEKMAADIRPAASSGMLRRYTMWALLLAGAITVLSCVITRPGLQVRFEQPDFVLQFCLWLAVVIVAGASAFILATPRWPMARGIRWAIGGLLVALKGFGAWLLIRMPTEVVAPADTSEVACILIVSGIGILTAISMVLALNGRARPTYPLLMAAMMAIAGIGAGMLAIMLVCPHEEAAHVLLSHFLPALGLGAAVLLVGQKWWRW